MARANVWAEVAHQAYEAGIRKLPKGNIIQIYCTCHNISLAACSVIDYIISNGVTERSYICFQHMMDIPGLNGCRHKRKRWKSACGKFGWSEVGSCWLRTSCLICMIDLKNYQRLNHCKLAKSLSITVVDLSITIIIVKVDLIRSSINISGNTTLDGMIIAQ